MVEKIHWKTADERATELAELADALTELIGVLLREQLFPEAVPWFQEYRERVLACAGGPTPEQAELNELARDVPAVIDLHPRWEPPLCRLEDGSYAIEDWYVRLQPAHSRVQRAAFSLRITGEYERDLQEPVWPWQQKPR